jgi:hypothetical protein
MSLRLVVSDEERRQWWMGRYVSARICTLGTSRRASRLILTDLYYIFHFFKYKCSVIREKTSYPDVEFSIGMTP